MHSVSCVGLSVCISDFIPPFLVLSLSPSLSVIVCYDPGNLQKRSALGGLEHLLGNEKCDLSKQHNHTQCSSQYCMVVFYLHSLHVLCIMVGCMESICHTLWQLNYTMTYLQISSALCVYSWKGLT